MICTFQLSLLLSLVLNSCDGNDAKPLLTPSALLADTFSESLMVSVALSKIGCTVLNYFSSSHEWKLTANTTVKLCWRSTCCQSWVALLATRLCSSNTVHLRTAIVKQSSSFNRKQRILPLDLWPPNSPDINPVDYRIWELMQERVHKTPVRDTSDMKQRVIGTRARISQNVVDEAVDRWRKRLSACVKAKTHLFEHLLK